MRPSSFHRVRARATAALALVAALAGGTASAQGWPQAPIRLVVPWAAGGSTDMIARALAQPLGQALGTSVVVDNRPGAGGNIGTAQAIKEKPDGYTLLLVTSTTQAVNPYLYQKPGFDPRKDFTPIVYIGQVPNVLVVPANSPFRTVQDVLDRARKEPGRLSFASGGNGSSQHIAGAMFERAGHVKLLHVPYKGGAPALTDLMGGQVDIMLDTGAMGFIQGGTLRPLAVASARRVPALPDVPTLTEAGVPLQTAAWYGLMGPAGMPKDVVARLNTEVNKLLKDPAVVKRLQDNGAVVGGGTPQEFDSLAAAELKRYGTIIGEAGIKAD